MSAALAQPASAARAHRGSRRARRADRRRARAPPRRRLHRARGAVRPARRGGGQDWTTIAFSQFSSSTRRTIVLAGVLNPVGRYGVARKPWCSASTAASAAPPPGRAPRRTARPPAEHVRGLRAQPGRERPAGGAAGARNGSRAGAATAARSRRATRRRPCPSRPAAGIDEAVPGSETGRMNASSSDVRSAGQHRADDPGEEHAERHDRHRDRGEPWVARGQRARADEGPAGQRQRPLRLQTLSHRPAEVDEQEHRERAERRERGDVGLPITLSPTANNAGMTIAVRAARRSAARPRSRVRSHASNRASLTLYLDTEGEFELSTPVRVPRRPPSCRHEHEQERHQSISAGSVPPHSGAA